MLLLVERAERETDGNLVPVSLSYVQWPAVSANLGAIRAAVHRPFPPRVLSMPTAENGASATHNFSSSAKGMTEAYPVLQPQKSGVKREVACPLVRIVYFARQGLHIATTNDVGDRQTGHGCLFGFKPSAGMDLIGSLSPVVSFTSVRGRLTGSVDLNS